jgi:hypothetical protein
MGNQQQGRTPEQIRKANRRLGLILLAIALAFFFSFFFKLMFWG